MVGNHDVSLRRKEITYVTTNVVIDRRAKISGRHPSPQRSHMSEERAHERKRFTAMLDVVMPFDTNKEKHLKCSENEILSDADLPCKHRILEH